jgi:hypothetical protein
VDARQLLEESFRGLSGLPCWNVRQGYGSFLTFEFGQPCLEIREPILDSPRSSQRRRLVTVLGEYHLWIEQCHWSVSEHQEQLAHSESESSVISRALDHLDGSILRTVRLVPDRGECAFDFEFDTSARLKRYADATPDDPIWHLYSNDLVLSYLSSGQLQFGRGDEQAPQLVACDNLEILISLNGQRPTG